MNGPGFFARLANSVFYLVAITALWAVAALLEAVSW